MDIPCPALLLCHLYISNLVPPSHCAVEVVTFLLLPIDLGQSATIILVVTLPYISGSRKDDTVLFARLFWLIM
jgi:hypothetical protein